MLLGAIFFVLGAIVASFMGVVAGRLNTGQSFLRGRSLCDACGVVLAPLTLVPILSYALGRGRAQCCSARLSLVAPLTELVLGGLYAVAYYKFGLSVTLLGVCVSLALLLALVLYDLAHQILPTTLLYSFIGASVVTSYTATHSFTNFILSLCVATLIGASLALIHLFSHGRAMGFADAPLAFGLATLVGKAAVSGLVFSFWIGAVVGLFLLLLGPRGTRMNSEVPFAPFLAAGFLLAFFTQWNIFDIGVALTNLLSL